MAPDKDAETPPTVDTAVPTPATENLSEAQKKALELGARIEHAQGPEQKDIHDEAKQLDPPAD